MPMDRSSFENRLHPDLKKENATFRMLDVWLLFGVKKLNATILPTEISKYKFKIMTNFTTKSSTKSDFSGNMEFCSKIKISPFAMGEISKAEYVFPFMFRFKEDKLLCFCEPDTQAERKEIITN
jgi:hypothetical protein